MKSGRQSIYNSDHYTKLFEGEWDPLEILEILRKAGVDFHGQRVLDIGGNTGGLSLEIARLGGLVTLSEPGEPLDDSTALLEEISRREGLSLRLARKGLYQALEEEVGFDIVVCLGLIYHFRNPQDILDRLNRIAPLLFLSCQTHAGASPFMMNRTAEGVMRPGFFDRNGRTLSGWHPTKACLEGMMRIAGYTPQLLTPKTIDFPRKLRGLTNSTYYFAKRDTTIAMDVNSVYYPR
jgi:2-polyprenyl-3-methyl-5-hydroxy-6-metoxy-1,4-benzoquinol methylase